MKKAVVTLELEIREYKVIEEALRNLKGKYVNQLKQYESNYETYRKVCDDDKILTKLMNELELK